MANSFHDNNHTPTLIAVQDDGATIRNVSANPTTHVLNVMDGTTGSNNGPTQSRHDANHQPILMAVSSADGKTPVAVYADSSGNLLVKST